MKGQKKVVVNKKLYEIYLYLQQTNNPYGNTVAERTLYID